MPEEPALVEIKAAVREALRGIGGRFGGDGARRAEAEHEGGDPREPAVAAGGRMASGRHGEKF
jgi:hypothetical protein